MIRDVIRIDRDKCNGCGDCVPACHEGAIKIIDGKAVLAADALCDGLGACLGECPQGAITIEKREAEAYNEIEALTNIMKEGPLALEAHLKHLKEHGQQEYLDIAQAYLQKRAVPAPMPVNNQPTGCGCPGGMIRDFRQEKSCTPRPPVQTEGASELQQWPVQLRLVNPLSAFFKDCEIVVSADCVPFSFADFHRRFLAGKILLVFCPKLDADLNQYVSKLSEILSRHNVRSVTVCRMEVPCCGGTLRVVEDAMKSSGKNIPIRQYTISLKGEII